MVVFLKQLKNKELEDKRPDLRLPIPEKGDEKPLKRIQEEEEKTEKRVFVIDLA